MKRSTADSRKTGSVKFHAFSGQTLGRIGLDPQDGPHIIKTNPTVSETLAVG
jgi:hypothetical protein